MGFSRQEYWSGLPFPSPGDLPNPGIEPRSPEFQAETLPSEPPGKPRQLGRKWQPTGVTLAGKSHGQRGLVHCSPWGSQRVGHDWATEHVQLGKVSHGGNAWDEAYIRGREGSWWEHIPGGALQVQVKVHGGRSEQVKGQQAAVAWIVLGDHLDLVLSHPLPLTSWVTLKGWPSWACLLGSKNGMTRSSS